MCAVTIDSDAACEYHRMQPSRSSSVRHRLPVLTGAGNNGFMSEPVSRAAVTRPVPLRPARTRPAGRAGAYGPRPGLRPRRRPGRVPRTPTAPPRAADRSDLPADRFLDRERSWLAFNERVLELAEDPDTPLLERANFLAIFASNLDEFFMVRVAGLKRRIATGVATRSASGLQPREVLELIWTRSRELMARHAACFQQDVAPALADEGIHLIRWHELTEKEQARLFTLFRQQIFPVLTPLAVDPAHPFPYISGLSLNLAVVVRNPVSGHQHFARVKVPPLLSRFLEASPQRYVPLEDVIAAHLEELFPGHGGAGAPHVPRHPQRGPGGRGGRRREPPPGPGEGAAAPPLRAAGAPGGRGVHRPVRPGPAGARAEDLRGRGLPAARARWT